jgi:hypothetical protein
MLMKIPAFARLFASVTALTLAAPALAQDNGANGSVSDFQLPTEDATPRAQPQGPVVEGIAPPRVARPSPTPAPAPPPVAIEAAPVTIDPGASTPSPQRGDAIRSAIDNFGAARPQATPTTAPAEATAEAAATAAAAAPPPATTARPGLALPQSSASQAAAPAPTPAAASSGAIVWWLWLLALLAVGAVGIFAGWFWRGRRAQAPLRIEAIERPQVPERVPEPIGPPAELPKVATRKPPEPEPAPAPAVAADHDEEAPERPLRIALEPARLSVSLLNATLAYRILLTNQGDTPLRDISIDGDMISAHASLSQEEQVAAPNSKLENRHLVRTLFPGETKVVSGDFALPLPMIRPIRNGDAALFVPLARLRVVAGGEHAEVIVQTSVVGQRSARPGGGLQPFRLDLGPRIYSELAQRAFA